MPQFTEGNGTYYWSQFDATQRSGLTYIDNKTGKVTFLAEVQPDAAFERVLEIAAKASKDSTVSAELSLSTARSIAELGERTAAVNMLRDGLYRIAELRYNDPETYTVTVVSALIRDLLAMVEHVSSSGDRTNQVAAKVELIDKAILLMDKAKAAEITLTKEELLKILQID